MGKRSKSGSSDELETSKKVKNKKIKLNNASKKIEVQPFQSNNKAETHNMISKDENVSEVSENKLVETVSPPQNKFKSSKKKHKSEKNDHGNNPGKELVTHKNVEIIESNVEVQKNTLTANEKVKTNKKQKSNSNKAPTRNKKIIFNDDEPIEMKDQANGRKQTKNKELTQEEDVKDEDIDKFCEEINEEDNVRYENWVKLIEVKLATNKKKTK